MAKDSIGNELLLDDLVRVAIGGNVMGSIVSIEPGGIVVPGGKQGELTAGKVKVLIEADVAFHPHNPVCAELLKVATPPEIAAQCKEARKRWDRGKSILHRI